MSSTGSADAAAPVPVGTAVANDDAASSSSSGPSAPSNDGPASSSDSASMSISGHGQGSTVFGATFNFTNSIVGAGAIGLGGAIAISGGVVSVVCILFFGLLTKLSLDMLIELTVGTDDAHNTYEELGRVAYGTAGRLSVLVSKTLYSFGCLVAYIIVVKDNFGSGLRHLIYRDGSSPDGSGGDFGGGGGGSWFEVLLEREELLTFIMSAGVILPLCLMRDMTTLSNFSIVSVFAMVAIVIIVVVLFIVNPGGEVRLDGGSTYEKWFEVRPGLLESLGTFVFTFVSQHTVHLAFESIDKDIRSVQNWRKVSLFSILIATAVSLSIGLFVYMTFWDKTESDIFDIYPANIHSIDAAKLQLCVTMLLTFPLPFFTCREMIVLVANDCFGQEEDEDEMRTSLLADEFGGELEDTSFFDPTGADVPEQRTLRQIRPWLLPGEERQLVLPYHVVLTTLLWATVTVLAITAPSLGDVLDLVGCATGTVIAFILPALFSFKLVGYTHLSAAILLVGGAVGSVGTYFSMTKLLSDE